MIIYPEDFKMDKKELMHELRCYCTECDKPFLDENGELVDNGSFRMCDECNEKFIDALIQRIGKVIAERYKQ